MPHDVYDVDANGRTAPDALGVLSHYDAKAHLVVARRILREIDLAEDATQQALVAIWRDLPQLRDPARFDA